MGNVGAKRSAFSPSPEERLNKPLPLVLGETLIPSMTDDHAILDFCYYGFGSNYKMFPPRSFECPKQIYGCKSNLKEVRRTSSRISETAYLKIYKVYILYR